MTCPRCNDLRQVRLHTVLDRDIQADVRGWTVCPVCRLDRLLVIIESPWAGDEAASLAYLRRCMRDSLARGEAPYASHGMFAATGVCPDDDPEDREVGILAGFAWGARSDATAVYTDMGFSPGMLRGMEEAKNAGRPVWMRSIGRGGT